MWPKIGTIPTYSLFYFTGILAHFLICYLLAKRFRVKRRVWLMISLCYLAGMTVGAKILYDLGHSQLDIWSLFRLNHWLEGGLWGGLLVYIPVAVIAVLLMGKAKRISLDLIALTIPIPWIFAKTGCLFNGCCYGRECSLPWAIMFPEGANGAPGEVPLHPTQLYEITLMIGILIIFTCLKKKRWEGTKLLWFLALYGIGRAVIDFFKTVTPQAVCIGPVTVTQLICLASALFAFCFLILLVRRKMVYDDTSRSSTS